jgi:uncharacterized coiled-coil DUF342 family protein
VKKISKEHAARLDEIIDNLREMEASVVTAVGGVNEQIEVVNAKIGEYNALLEEAEGIRDEVVGQMDEYSNERSEKWQEGDTGSAFNDWKSEWESADFTGIDEIDDIAAPDMDNADDIENLPKEPG